MRRAPQTRAAALIGAGLRHKYGVAPKAARTEDGITFDSKRELLRYQQLKHARLAGEVVQFLPQSPTFVLPGGVRYTADFLVFWADGRVTIEDTKGHRTESYKAKKRLVESIYAPITITEI